MGETDAYLRWKAEKRIEMMVKVGKLRLCDVCGRPFKPYNPVNVYCSFKCRQEANRYMAKMRKRRKARLEGSRMDIDDAVIGTWPNVAIEAGSDPEEVMRKYGRHKDERKTTMENEKSRMRADFLEEVQAFAARLAKEYKCDKMEKGENDFPIETMRDWMEHECGGDCSTNIVWTGGECEEGNSIAAAKPAKRVEFRFRFTNPCVSVSLDHRKTLAEIEFSDVIDGEHSGLFYLYGTSAWGHHGGVPLLKHIVEKWEEEH
jgi:hypothetical protein